MRSKDLLVEGSGDPAPLTGQLLTWHLKSNKTAGEQLGTIMWNPAPWRLFFVSLKVRNKFRFMRCLVSNPNFDPALVNLIDLLKHADNPIVPDYFTTATSLLTSS